MSLLSPSSIIPGHQRKLVPLGVVAGLFSGAEEEVVGISGAEEARSNVWEVVVDSKITITTTVGAEAAGGEGLAGKITTNHNEIVTLRSILSRTGRCLRRLILIGSLS